MKFAFLNIQSKLTLPQSLERKSEAIVFWITVSTVSLPYSLNIDLNAFLRESVSFVICGMEVSETAVLK